MTSTEPPTPHASGLWIRIFQASVVASGFALFLIGRILMYPVALAPGGLLDRIRAEPVAWDRSHRILLVAALLHIPAVLIVCRFLASRSPRLSTVGATLLVAGAALSIGQFALDYAVLAASTLPAPAGDQVFAAFRNHPFVDLAFYKSSNITGLGFIVLAIAMWMQRGLWRLASLFLVCMIVCSIIQSRFGVHGPRITLLFQALAGISAAFALLRKPAATPELPA